MKRSLPHLLLLCVTLCAAPAWSQTREDARLITATQVMEELRDTPDQNVPDWLLQRAYGIAVVPEVVKGAFIFGGRYGNGVFTARDASGRFSNPVFIRLGGGSVGWQVGVTSTDVVLIFATQRSVENFGRGKVTLGADASVAAGPVGRQGEAAGGVNAEVYSYSRARGLFAGVALSGTVLWFDNDATSAFYGSDVSSDDVIKGKVTTRSESARRFLAAIGASVDGTSTPAPGPGPGPGAVSTPTANPAAPAAPTPPPPGSGVKTFPMEDTKPGSEPR
jgi:lipid-binding SYLF domain-containing protein